MGPLVLAGSVKRYAGSPSGILPPTTTFELCTCSQFRLLPNLDHVFQLFFATLFLSHMRRCAGCHTNTLYPVHTHYISKRPTVP